MGAREIACVAALLGCQDPQIAEEDVMQPSATAGSEGHHASPDAAVEASADVANVALANLDDASVDESSRPLGGGEETAPAGADQGAGGGPEEPGSDTPLIPSTTAGIEGTIADGETIRIVALAGEDFGDLGPPAAQLFDQFAGAQADVEGRTDTPYFGSWILAGYTFTAEGHSDYVTAHSLSRGVAWQGFTQATQGSISLRTNRLQMRSVQRAREVFMSANMFVPEGGFGPTGPYVDAEGWPAASYAKLFWIEDGAKGGAEAGAWDMLGASILNGNLELPASGNESILNGQSGEFPAWDRSHHLKQFWDHSRWHVLQYGFVEPSELYGGVPAAYGRVGVQGKQTVWVARDTSATYSPFEPGVSDGFDHLAVPGYLRDQEQPTASPRQIYFDDIYLALGPGAMCRVELHDTEDDRAATVVAVQPVAHGDWTASSILLTLRFNDLVPKSPDGYWLKVYGRNGERITARKVGAAQ